MLERIIEQMRDSGKMVPKMVGDLPLDPKSMKQVDEVMALGQELLPKLAGEFGADASTHEIAGALMSLIRQRHDAGGVTLFKWKQFVLCLEKAESHLSKNTPQDIQEKYARLLAGVQECEKQFSLTEIKIRVYGERADLDELNADLVADFLNQIEAAQAELAKKYGWTRGKTTCCDKVGYNPPLSMRTRPVHDAEEPALSEREELLSDLLEQVRAGRVRVKMVTRDQLDLRDKQEDE